MSKGIVVNGVKITWLGHDGFLLEQANNGKKIIIDPFKLSENLSADIVLITHDHPDHCSIADLKRVVRDDTIIFLPADCISSLAGRVGGKTVILEPGKKVNVQGITIETVPAYNTNKHFHPKENQWNGYVVTINGVRIYHAGDTDRISEMKLLHGIVDVALLPVSGKYTMTAEEAAMAANEIMPKLAIPMHWGAGVVGTIEDAEKFKQLCKCDVKILEK
jgi:L-ascorbate metabolism protein UlaG (beta-lactamase superfamily)